MHPALAPVVTALRLGQPVDREQFAQAIGVIMDGDASEVEIAALLTALAIRGETADDLAGVAAAMRERMTRIPMSRTGLVDTCGTGGDGLQTFNISTATAIVVAAGGVPVAKHGNRSVSSSSGSADVLEQLGVNINLTPDQVGRCIDEVGIGFCFARLLHSAMKHVAPVRAALGFRTIFNLVGPLTNPAGARHQLLGANSIETAEKMAEALARLGTQRSFIVCGANQLDEVALWNLTSAFEVKGNHVEHLCWSASDFGLPECSPDDLRVASAAESADVIRSIVDGAKGPARNIVVANAASAFLVAGKVSTLHVGVELAASLLDKGTAKAKLYELVNWTAARV
jgi:anthranilate phosphoribosyltransferase